MTTNTTPTITTKMTATTTKTMTTKTITTKATKKSFPSLALDTSVKSVRYDS